MPDITNEADDRPCLLIEAGAPIPPDTPPGTRIFEKYPHAE